MQLRNYLHYPLIQSIRLSRNLRPFLISLKTENLQVQNFVLLETRLSSKQNILITCGKLPIVIMALLLLLVLAAWRYCRCSCCWWWCSSCCCTLPCYCYCCCCCTRFYSNSCCICICCFFCALIDYVYTNLHVIIGEHT
jgi:hypothetical protein